MRRTMNYLLLGLITMFLLTYIMGLFDDSFHKTGVWYKDILASIKYYVTWVLPYWWLIILIGSIVLALIFYGLKIGLDKIKG
jgi:riboflavin transporter FmnP